MLLPEKVSNDRFYEYSCLENRRWHLQRVSNNQEYSKSWFARRNTRPENKTLDCKEQYQATKELWERYVNPLEILNCCELWKISVLLQGYCTPEECQF